MAEASVEQSGRWRETAPGRPLTKHSVVRFTVIRAAEACPVFKAGDVFVVRQHVLDTEVSTIRNFCFHSLSDLYSVYKRVRSKAIGSKETMDCRDKAMVQFEAERLADEDTPLHRGEVSRTATHGG